MRLYKHYCTYAAPLLALQRRLKSRATPCGRARCGGSHAHAYPNRLPQLRAYRRCQRRVPSARSDLLTMRSQRIHQEWQTGEVAERCT
jgi:hypothetical protein